MSAPCPTLGFRLVFTIASHVDASRRDAVHRAFLETLAAYGLNGEAAEGAVSAYTITGDGTQATESDRERLVAWLDEQPEIAGHRVGPLTDVGERV